MKNSYYTGPVTLYFLRRLKNDYPGIRNILKEVKDSAIIHYSDSSRSLYFFVYLGEDLETAVITTQETRPYYLEKIGKAVVDLSQETRHQWKNYLTFYSNYFLSNSVRNTVINLIYDYILNKKL